MKRERDRVDVRHARLVQLPPPFALLKTPPRSRRKESPVLVDRKIEDVPLGQARARGPPTCTAIGALEHAASAWRIHDLRVPGN